MYLKRWNLHVSEEEVENLVINARNLRTENKVLKEEIIQLKEVSL